MKSNDLLKLALGAGAGYLGISLLSHKGYAGNPLSQFCPTIQKIPGCNLVFLAGGALLILMSVI